MLHSITYGEPTEKPPLLIAHGLFGSARNWGVIAKRMSDERQVVAVDIRNHGESPWSDNHSYDAMASDLAEVAQPFGPVDLLGHSMGGKAAMMLAVKQPELIRRLVVADIAPVAYSHSQNHLIEAMRKLDLRGLTLRSVANKQLADWVPEESVRAFLLQSLDLKAGRWRLNLNALETWMAQTTGWPDPIGQVELPVLFLSGAESDYVTNAGRNRAKKLFPKARFAKIPGAGHWLHADKPREFEATLRVFLNA